MGWTEAHKCREMDELAQEDHTYKATKEELDRYRSNWTLQLNDSTFNGPMALRDDHKAAVALKNHLYRQSEDYQKPIPPQYQDRRREGNQFTETYRQGHEFIQTMGVLLSPGGRVIIGMSGTITTRNTW